MGDFKVSGIKRVSNHEKPCICYKGHSHSRKILIFVRLDIFFNSHVPEFAGFENFPALLAFDKFRVFFAGDYAHTWVLTGLLNTVALRSWFRGKWTLTWVHIQIKPPSYRRLS